MRRLPTIILALTVSAGSVVQSSAQTLFLSIQPNETKEQATPAFGMVHGDRLAAGGTCSTVGGSEVFHIRTAPLPPGIYRQRLAPPFLIAANFPAILGRTQLNGVIDPASTVQVQQGTNQTTPRRLLQWYEFGQAADIYVDLDSVPLCRSSFIMTLDTARITPTPVQTTLAAGDTLDLRPTQSSPTTDIDLWLYDADFDAIPGASRRSLFAGSPELNMVVTEGTYYVGVSLGPFYNNQAATIFDSFDSDHVLDFRGAAVSGRLDSGVAIELVLGTTIFQGVFTEPFEILWYRIDVATGQSTQSFCPGDGTAGACACGPSTIGQGAGCANSTGLGARLFAHSFLEPDKVEYTLEDLPPGAAAVVFASLSTGAGMPVYGGNSCIGGSLVRLGPLQADALGRASVRSGTPFGQAGFLAGSTVYAQAAYRDAAVGIPCNANFTNGAAAVLR